MRPWSSIRNLYELVTEHFNLVHIFRDAQTVPFDLTDDQYVSCLSLSLRASSQHRFLIASGHVVNAN